MSNNLLKINLRVAKISEYLDKTYIYIMKNFIRFGIFLLILGALFIAVGLFLTAGSSTSFSQSIFGLASALVGGFFFLSGSLFIIASTPRK